MTRIALGRLPDVDADLCGFVTARWSDLEHHVVTALGDLRVSDDVHVHEAWFERGRDAQTARAFGLTLADTIVANATVGGRTGPVPLFELPHPDDHGLFIVDGRTRALVLTLPWRDRDEVPDPVRVEDAIQRLKQAFDNALKAWRGEVRDAVRRRGGELKPENVHAVMNGQVFETRLMRVLRDHKTSMVVEGVNALDRLTAPRRVRDRRSTLDARHLHDWARRRLCPVETPEGDDCGLVSSLALGATVSEDGQVVAGPNMLGLSASLIPFIAHDDGVRATMGANMMRQALPLVNPQPPRVGTGYEHLLDARLGRDLVVAFMPWHGWSFEDAIVVGQHVVDQDLLTSVHEDVEELLVFEGDSLDIVGHDEFVRVGTRVKAGQMLAIKGRAKTNQRRANLMEQLALACLGEQAAEWEHRVLRAGSAGVVTAIHVVASPELQHAWRFKDGQHPTGARAMDGNLPTGVIARVRVTVRSHRRLQVGDKLAGRHGNKGVVGAIVPLRDMPHLPDGRPVDVLLNPLGVPSRLNPGQLLETQLGWAAQKLDRWYAVPPFGAEGLEERVDAITAEAGLPPKGRVTLIDSRTGQPFEQPVTVGVMHLMRLKHLAAPKCTFRGKGPYHPLTRQPVKGRHGGQRLGEMELWALEAHGARHLLQEALTTRSDGHGQDQNATLHLLLSELRALNLTARFTDEGLKLAFARAREVEARSHGPRTDGKRWGANKRPPAEGIQSETFFGPLEDYACQHAKFMPGDAAGRACSDCGVEYLPSYTRRYRSAHVRLAMPVVHPLAWRWGANPPLARALGWSRRRLARAIRGPGARDLYRQVHQQLGPAGEQYFITVLDLMPAGLRPRTVLESGVPVDDDLDPACTDLLKANTLALRGTDLPAPMRDSLYQGLQLAVERIMDSRPLALNERTLTQSAAARDLLAWLRLLHDGDLDDLARAARAPARGLGRQSVADLRALELPPLEALRAWKPASKARRQAAKAMLDVLERGRALRDDAGLRARWLAEHTGLRDALADQDDEAVSALDDLADALDGAPLADALERIGARPGRPPRRRRSLADRLAEKEGRLRQDVLGRRVDFSGRAVIAPGPDLALDQVGVPRAMWDRMPFTPVVLLNRQPTLHRWGLLAFRPVPVPGSAIRLHPLVCAGFNADFDGDTMALHVPRSPQAIQQALTLLPGCLPLGSRAGRPTLAPTHEMVLGLHWLTLDGGGDVHVGDEDAILDGLHSGRVHPHAPVWVGRRTTAGRLAVERLLPGGHPGAVEAPLDRRALDVLLKQALTHCGLAAYRRLAQRLMGLGFEAATAAGLSISLDSLPRLRSPRARSLSVEQWEGVIATREDDLLDALQDTPDDPLAMMLASGARSNIGQVRQLAVMRGLVADLDGEVCSEPVLQSLRDGVPRDAFWNSLHGARKGLVDTALNTGESGGLMRRLVNACHAMTVTEASCDTPGHVLGCSAEGVCAACYGDAPSTGQPVQVGAAVGVIAAQTLGERLTQLTLRTFQSGGDAADTTIASVDQVKQALRRPADFAPDAAAWVRGMAQGLDPTVVPATVHLQVLARCLYPDGLYAAERRGGWLERATVGSAMEVLAQAADAREVDPLTGPRARKVVSRA